MSNDASQQARTQERERQRAERIAAALRALTEARLAMAEAEARVRWCTAVAKDAAIALDKARVGDGDE